MKCTLALKFFDFDLRLNIKHVECELVLEAFQADSVFFSGPAPRVTFGVSMSGEYKNKQGEAAR